MLRQSRFVLAAATLAIGFVAATGRVAAAEESTPTLSLSSSTADSSFLVKGVAANEQQAQGQVRHEGVGFGVKGGFLFNNFSQAQADIQNKSGWQVGIFFGGNRPGVVGVMGEILYAKKSFAQSATSPTQDLYFIEIPILARVNIGSSTLNGVSFYGIVGPAFDINLQSKQEDLDVKDNYESLDIGLIFGGGVEITRFLVEARYNKGLKNVLKSTGGGTSDLKTSTFAVMVGFRFN